MVYNSIPPYPQTPLSLLAYSDSDLGSDTATHRRRSVSGTIIILSGEALLYSTKFKKLLRFPVQRLNLPVHPMRVNMHYYTFDLY